MGEARARRIFFALWPEDEATGHLAALAHSLAAGGGRAIRPASLHLTLAFVGSVTPSQVIELEQIAAVRRLEMTRLPLDLPYGEIRGLSKEEQEKLLEKRPETLGQASRMSGVNPSAVQAIIVFLKGKEKRDHGDRKFESGVDA